MCARGEEAGGAGPRYVRTAPPAPGRQRRHRQEKKVDKAGRWGWGRAPCAGRAHSVSAARGAQGTEKLLFEDGGRGGPSEAGARPSDERRRVAMVGGGADTQPRARRRRQARGGHPSMGAAPVGRSKAGAGGRGRRLTWREREAPAGGEGGWSARRARGTRSQTATRRAQGGGLAGVGSAPRAFLWGGGHGWGTACALCSLH